MNNEEINKIDDLGLRNIRLKYWELKHKAFLDEHGIPDQELGKVWDMLTEKEEKEVSSYLAKSRNCKGTKV